LSFNNSPFSICAVNYLNTVPLVWGMANGPQREQVQLHFETPSSCADMVERGSVQIGLVPVAEVSRQKLDIVSEVGIACRGAVRSILLVSRKPIRQIQTLAVDSSSRTSVQLARVVLREVYGANPETISHPPQVDHMLEACDAALMIGDNALKIDPYGLEYEVLDLGAEWYALTGLPMVFALWAGRVPDRHQQVSRILEDSFRHGCENIENIVEQEFRRRDVTRELAHEYLTRYIRFEIGDAEWKGLEAFLELAGLEQVGLTAAGSR
jgi:predicted solute-binding protein